MEGRELPGSKKSDQRTKDFTSVFWTLPQLQCKGLLPSKDETVKIHPSDAQWQDTQFGIKPEPFIWRKIVPLCCILLNSWLLPLSFSLSLMHYTKLLSTETAAIWVPRRAQTMKQRSYKDDEQASNGVIQGLTLNAQVNPGGLRSADLGTDSTCVTKKPLLSSWQPQGKILAVCGECGGQANAPDLSCSRIKSFLSPAKQQHCQGNPCRQGWNAALPMESPCPRKTNRVFPLVFVFSRVLGLHCSCKGC